MSGKGIYTTQVKSPCKGCPDRHLVCHGACDKYGDFVIKMGEWKKARNDELEKRYIAGKNGSTPVNRWRKKRCS